MKRNVQLGLIGGLLVTVAAALLITFLLKSDGTPSTDPTETPGASATAGSPTAAASPSPTFTPVPPTPTPTPLAPDAAAQAMALLVGQGKAEPGDLTLVSYQRASWPDASLDCPAPGVVYAQVETAGWRIIINNAGEEIEFHSDQAGNSLFNCTERLAALEGTVNVFELENLAETSSIDFERFNFETQVYEKFNEESDQPDIQKFLAVLDTPVEAVESDGCQAVFRLTFHTPSGAVQVETICGSNTQMVRGQASAWDGRDGAAPPELGNLVATYLPASGIPTIPGG